MRGALAAAALFALSLSSPAAPAEPAAGRLGLPGYGWLQFRVPSSPDPYERGNAMLDGAVHQGLEWLELGGGVRIRSFAQVNYSRDIGGFDWNNKARPALGTQLQFSPSRGTFVELGIKHEWDRREVSGRTLAGWIGFLNWSGWADRSIVTAADTPAVAPSHLWFTTWGQLRHPGGLEAFERTNPILEGAFDASMDFGGDPGTGAVNLFAHLQYKLDRDGLDYNNELKPSAGARLRLALGPKARIEIGAMTTHRHRFLSGRSDRAATGFVNWSASW